MTVADKRERDSLSNAIMSKRKKRGRRGLYSVSRRTNRRRSAKPRSLRSGNCTPRCCRYGVFVGAVIAGSTSNAAARTCWLVCSADGRCCRRRCRRGPFARSWRGTAPGASGVAHRMGFAPLPAVEFCLMLDVARGVIRDARRDPVVWFPAFRFLSEPICSLVTTKPSQIQRMAEARPNSPATRRA
jgi:hypothetical protein